MMERLKAAMERYEELGALLGQGEIPAGSERFRTLMKEYSDLTPLCTKYTAYKDALQRIKEAEELLSSGDRELEELAKEELKEGKEECRTLEGELRTMLVPPDPLDGKNVVVEIRACAGGEEAALFAADLYRMYGMYADRKGLKVEKISENPTELGGYREIDFLVSGQNAYSSFKFESGVHRVQRVPETESQGRIQTSTVSVAVLPEADEVEVHLDPADISFESCKSSGAGGQHINKTESAVRITHLPTGIVVGCQTERSQLQNKETALKMLKSKLMEIKLREHLDKIEDIQGTKANIEWGSQIRSYVFMPYTLAKDTRTGYEDPNISSVMDGNIDGFINAYLKMNA